ncbi:hypothetical protein JG688_00016110, partial [Phytophthora aleatoria]
ALRATGHRKLGTQLHQILSGIAGSIQVKLRQCQCVAFSASVQFRLTHYILHLCETCANQATPFRIRRR